MCLCSRECTLSLAPASPPNRFAKQPASRLELFAHEKPALAHALQYVLTAANCERDYVGGGAREPANSALFALEFGGAAHITAAAAAPPEQPTALAARERTMFVQPQLLRIFCLRSLLCPIYSYTTAIRRAPGIHNPFLPNRISSISSSHPQQLSLYTFVPRHFSFFTLFFFPGPTSSW